MQVYAANDESDTGNIKVGAPVTFQVDAFPNQQFHGRVSTVRLNPTTVQNVITSDAVIISAILTKNCFRERPPTYHQFRRAIPRTPF